MADSLSLASSTIALVTSAFRHTITLQKTFNSFDFHTKQVKDLVDELESLSDVLQTLKEAITITIEVDLSAVKLPLLRCSNACVELKEEILRCSSHSRGSQFSFRDWTRIKYRGKDLDGFRHLLFEYKSTLNLGLAAANLQISSFMARGLQEQQDQINDMIHNLENSLRGIDEKLEAGVYHFSAGSNSDAEKPQALEEEHNSAKKHGEAYHRASDLGSQGQLKSACRNQESSDLFDLNPLPKEEPNESPQDCTENLRLTAAKLEKNMRMLLKKLRSNSKTGIPSQEDIEDLSRLRHEWETVHRCLDIFTRAGQSSKGSIGIDLEYSRRGTTLPIQSILISPQALGLFYDSIREWLNRYGKKAAENVQAVTPNLDTPPGGEDRVGRPLSTLSRFSLSILRFPGKLQNLMTSVEVVRVFWEPRVSPNHERLRWHCSCGKLLYGDFDKTDPQALGALALSLKALRRDDTVLSRDPYVNAVTRDCDGLDTMPTQQSVSANHLSRDLSGSAKNGDISSSGSQSRHIGAEIDNSINIQDQATASNRKIPVLRPQKTYFEVCVNSGEYAIVLDEIDVSSVKSDAELFAKISRTYDSVRGGWIRKRFIKPRGIHFVYFGVRHRHQAGIYKGPEDIPPINEVIHERYHYHECPLTTLPPMPANVFLHYLSCAQNSTWASQLPDAHNENIFLQRLPKKVHRSIFDELTAYSPSTRSSGIAFGWGIHIIEGPNHTALSLALGLGIFLSFVISLVVFGIAKTQEQGFGIGQFLLATVACGMGAVYFKLQEL